MTVIARMKADLNQNEGAFTYTHQVTLDQAETLFDAIEDEDLSTTFDEALGEIRTDNAKEVYVILAIRR